MAVSEEIVEDRCNACSTRKLPSPSAAIGATRARPATVACPSFPGIEKATGIIASTDSAATSQNIKGQPSWSTANDASQGASAVPVHNPVANALMP